MAFEDGFDPRYHFEPIINSFKSSPDLPQRIIDFWENEINDSNWPKSVKSSYERLQSLFPDNWSYNCFIQFMEYEIEVRNGTRVKSHAEENDFDFYSPYEEFFNKIIDHYIPKIIKARSDIERKNS